MVASTSPAGHSIMYRRWLFNPSTAIPRRTQREESPFPSGRPSYRYIWECWIFSVGSVRLSKWSIFKREPLRDKLQWQEIFLFANISRPSESWQKTNKLLGRSFSVFPREVCRVWSGDQFECQKLTIVPGANSKQWDWSPHGPATWSIYGTINHNDSFSLFTGKDCSVSVCVCLSVRARTRTFVFV